MESAEALKRKLLVSKDLRSIVRTMKSLAAVGMRQAESSLQGLEQVKRTIALGLDITLGDGPIPTLPVPSQSTGAIVFGSDQGLCGQFNERIALFARDQLEQTGSGPRGPALLAVGERVVGPLEDAGLHVERCLSVPGSSAGATPLVQELLLHVDQWMTQGRVGRVVLHFTRATGTAAVAPLTVQLVPVDLSAIRATDHRRMGVSTMPRLDLLAALIREHLFTTLYEALLRSMYSENLSRFSTTSAAEKNIDEVFRELRGRFHQHRQATVTAELLDITSGVEALR